MYITKTKLILFATLFSATLAAALPFAPHAEGEVPYCLEQQQIKAENPPVAVDLCTSGPQTKRDDHGDYERNGRALIDQPFVEESSTVGRVSKELERVGVKDAVSTSGGKSAIEGHELADDRGKVVKRNKFTEFMNKLFEEGSFGFDFDPLPK